METDNIWTKVHPDQEQLLQTRTFGQHYIYDSVPNASERIEMSFRSLGRQYDWDLEKYRISKKPSDKGNKRRLFKNVPRMLKNPFGYFTWKSFHLLNNSNIVSIALSLGLVFAIMELNTIANCKKKQRNFLEMEGHHESGTGLMDTTIGGNKFPIPNSPIWKAMWSYPSSSTFVVNPVVNQNYRMYFDRMDYA